MMIIPNTPILEHFKRLTLPVPSHFNQSMMLSASRRLNVFTLKASLGILCQYHDMLRTVWDSQQLKVCDVTAGNQFHLEEHNLKNSSDTPLSINCAMIDGRLSGTLSYDKGVLDESQAHKLCEAFAAQLKSLNEQK